MYLCTTVYREIVERLNFEKIIGEKMISKKYIQNIMIAFTYIAT